MIDHALAGWFILMVVVLVLYLTHVLDDDGPDDDSGYGW